MWDAVNGLQGLGDLPGGIFLSQALDVSADGLVVVGGSYSTAGGEAFIWDAINGMQSLGDLPGGNVDGIAIGVSADGSVVAGQGHSASGTEAFIWDAINGLLGLGDLPGGDFDSLASDISGDGSIVVGSGETTECPVFDPTCQFSQPQNIRAAFVWDAASGMRSLQEILEFQGVDLTGWHLTTAQAISADGRTIVGAGVNPSGFFEAFIATIPEPSTALLLGMGVLGLAVHGQRSHPA